MRETAYQVVVLLAVVGTLAVPASDREGTGTASKIPPVVLENVLWPYEL